MIRTSFYLHLNSIFHVKKKKESKKKNKNCQIKSFLCYHYFGHFFVRSLTSHSEHKIWNLSIQHSMESILNVKFAIFMAASGYISSTKKNTFFFLYLKIKSVCVFTVKMSRLLNFDVACFVFFFKRTTTKKKL